MGVDQWKNEGATAQPTTVYNLENEGAMAYIFSMFESESTAANIPAEKGGESDAYDIGVAAYAATCFSSVPSNITSPSAPGDMYEDFGGDTPMVGIDSRCSYSISAFIEDFVGELVPCNVSIDGLTNAAKASFRGTIRWNFEDHQGVIHQV